MCNDGKSRIQSLIVTEPSFIISRGAGGKEEPASERWQSHPRQRSAKTAETEGDEQAGLPRGWVSSRVCPGGVRVTELQHACV